MRGKFHAMARNLGLTVGFFAFGDVFAADLPGDIAASAGTPLVAAHSMARALYAAYAGNLFQVRRASDSQTRDIGVVGAGGTVDMTALNTFGTGTVCTVSKLYDQSGNHNDLSQPSTSNQPSLLFWSEPDGSKIPMAVTEHAQQWLRNRGSTSKIPVGSASQTEYFVVYSHYANNGCCFDYGNMENPVGDAGSGTMNALNFSFLGFWACWPGAGAGPWGGVDFENGVYAGGFAGVNPANPSTTYDLVTVLSKTNGTTLWALKAGDASTGILNTYWNGALPNGYNPLHQQGGLSLGEGGDGSNAGTGAFFEGVVIAAVTSDSTDALIQRSIAGIFGATSTEIVTGVPGPGPVNRSTLKTFFRSGRLIIVLPEDGAHIEISGLSGRTIYGRRYSGMSRGSEVEVDLRDEMGESAASMLVVTSAIKDRTLRAVVPITRR